METNKPSSEEIYSLIVVLTHIQQKFSMIGNQMGNPLMAFQNNKMLDVFKCVLYLAWERYGYGCHSDFLREGDSVLDYMMFEINAEKIMADLIDILQEQSPFRLIEKEGTITQGLLTILTTLQDDLGEEGSSLS